MTKHCYFKGSIKSLYPDEVFVFGSNLSGVHGAGAARTARVEFGAVMGQGVGMTGQCYAIPSKDENINTMRLSDIRPFVDSFIEFAKNNPNKIFMVTKIGCGLAGYTDADIAPMFRSAPLNCWFDLDWEKYIEAV